MKLVTVILLTSVVLFSCGGYSDYEDNIMDQDPTELAEACAQTEIKELLKSPSTAEFNTKAVVTEWDENTFAVSGTVDSQNSFGAIVRSNYRCKITFKNNKENYTISDIDIR